MLALLTPSRSLAWYRSNERKSGVFVSRSWLKYRGWCWIALGVVFVLTLSLPAFSQSCALCYTQAASSGQRIIQALRSGILILVIPPTLGSIGMVFLLRQRGQQIRRSNGESAELDEWQNSSDAWGKSPKW